MPIWVNILLTIVIILINIVLCSIFYFLASNNYPQNDLAFPVSGYYNFLYKNEKSIYAICLGFLIILICTFKKDASLNAIFNNRVCSLFNRIGYGYLAAIELVTYLLYCLGELEVELNALNIFYTTWGLIFVLTVIGVLIVIVFEIPMRIICKQLLKMKFADEEIDKIENIL